MQNIYLHNLNNHFYISGIPRYVLVDKKGNIVDKNVLRPELAGSLNKELIDKIEKLLPE